ncbi:MAG: PaaI family thioesterase [Spirochaetales bacterium]|nr:MAG: PaaI family thioesterase [Spirochaetales bacterium]
MKEKAFQEYYPEHFSHCYGCGVLNEHGLRIKSYWDGEESVCTFQPMPYHTSFPGFVYGGLIASVIDCHSTATAAAAAYRADGRAMDTDPPLRYVTASLKVDYILPTPLDSPMVLRSAIKEMKGRKVIVTTSLSVLGRECARGELVAVQVPDTMIGK